MIDSDTIFQNFLENYMHVQTVDTRHSFLLSALEQGCFLRCHRSDCSVLVARKPHSWGKILTNIRLVKAAMLLEYELFATSTLIILHKSRNTHYCCICWGSGHSLGQHCSTYVQMSYEFMKSLNRAGKASIRKTIFLPSGTHTVLQGG